MDAPVTITFSWYDYVIFGCMLGISAIIGIYFGCFGTKQSTPVEYLMGGKKMGAVPIAVSLVASHVSGLTLLAVPAEVYKFGAAYWLIALAFVLVVVVTIYVYLPVLFYSETPSVYSYLGKRFDEKTRMLSSFFFVLTLVMFLPIVIYIPALALSAATGISVNYISPTICAICIFYTTIGGLKTVVWTDNIQLTLAVCAIIVVLILGVDATGGFSEVWLKATKGQRLDFFDFDPDVTRSNNFWAPFVGLTFLWISWTNTNQSCIQKLFSVSTFKEAKLATVLYGIGMSLMATFGILMGLIIYAKYSNCDPFLTNQLTRNDELVPFYVLDVGGHIPGIAGLFIAGVFSVGLSTYSAQLNCMSATIYDDFVSKFVSKSLSDGRKNTILKVIVVVCGVISTGLVFVVERLGGMFGLAQAFSGIPAGPLLGMFTLGILFRRANSHGAFYGGIVGLVVIMCLSLPAKYLESQRMIVLPEKPVGVDGCNFDTNVTFVNVNDDGVSFAIFRISYYYTTMIGFLVTLVCGLAVSYATTKNVVDENLLSPVIRKVQNSLSK
ncbi:sodium-coupled monocarboxylate transporter 1-like isoform X1 [Zophobas morio]|uniref:sodium-coupled monocarboxylate transporter 1-like isoform X1 n=1 Tax=Zophobas morio TaxID=2755281 RepID=UPI00308315D0